MLAAVEALRAMLLSLTPRYKFGKIDANFLLKKILAIFIDGILFFAQCSSEVAIAAAIGRPLCLCLAGSAPELRSQEA